MKLALRTAGPAIFASGMTVIAALLCLTLADVNGTSGLGPVGALGVAVAMLAMLTLLPAWLVIWGRGAFWPRVPRFGSEGTDETHGAWRRVGDRVARRPRRVWIGAVALLLVLSLGLLNFDNGLTSGNSFRDDVEAVAGQELLAQSFPSGSNAPTDVIVPDPARVPAVREALVALPGVDAVRPVQRGKEGVLLAAVLDPDPFSTEAFDLIPAIRATAKRAGGEATLVGGATAVEYDLRQASARDNKVIVPIALVVVLLILIALLRALVAPIMLIVTVILSFGASLGVGAIIFDVVFGFPGSDPSLPLFAFIFLVALGIDYNIFLMARVREETLRHGTREGMLRGLAVTGAVITSAGVVLAGVFSVLGVLPLVFLTEIGFVVAFGVLLDTFLVRSVLVPALTFDIGPKIWLPSKLAERP
jgi:RND superfamily putative drug exporter